MGCIASLNCPGTLAALATTTINNHIVSSNPAFIRRMPFFTPIETSIILLYRAFASFRSLGTKSHTPSSLPAALAQVHPLPLGPLARPTRPASTSTSFSRKPDAATPSTTHHRLFHPYALGSSRISQPVPGHRDPSRAAPFNGDLHHDERLHRSPGGGDSEGSALAGQGHRERNLGRRGPHSQQWSVAPVPLPTATLALSSRLLCSSRGIHRKAAPRHRFRHSPVLAAFSVHSADLVRPTT